MAIPTLPEELLFEIISYFDTNPLDTNERGLRVIARYAPVSKQWATLVERITFRHLRLTLLRLPEFARIVTGRRRQFLRSINLQMLLHPQEKEEFTFDEMLEQEAAHDMTFTLMVQKLFAILNSWGGDIPMKHSRGIDLLLSTYSPSDDDREHEQFDTSFVRFRPELLTQMGSLVPRLPNVYCVTELRTYAYSSKFWPASMFQIAASLPNLHCFHAEFWDSAESMQLRLQARKELAKYLWFLPNNCRELDLVYGFETAPGASKKNLSLLSPGQMLDPFSANLVDLSHKLVALVLESAVFDIAAFMQDPSKDWPYLQLLQFELAPLSPNGEWYFDHEAEPEPVPGSTDDSRDSDSSHDDPESDSADELTDGELLAEFEDMEDNYNDPFPGRVRGPWDNRRTLPRKDMLDEVYITIAKFVRRMPRLEALNLEFVLDGQPAQRYPCHSFFYRPHKNRELIDDASLESTAEIEWACLPQFEPDQTLLQVWQDTAALLGRELNIEFKHPRPSPPIPDEDIERYRREHHELMAENRALMQADHESTARNELLASTPWDL